MAVQKKSAKATPQRFVADVKKMRERARRHMQSGAVTESYRADRAQVIIEAFRRPYRFPQVHTAGLYDDAGFCEQCDAAYCHRHWHLSDTGHGRCPHQHGKSLDPSAPPG